MSESEKSAPARSDFLVTEPKQTLFRFLEERAHLRWTADFTAVGRVVNGQLVGAVAVVGFNGASCMLHFAGDNKYWINRKLIDFVFRYIFRGLGCNIIFAEIASGNTTSLAVARKVGFKDLLEIPGAHPDGSLHLLAMRREECRWLPRKKLC